MQRRPVVLRVHNEFRLESTIPRWELATSTIRRNVFERTIRTNERSIRINRYLSVGISRGNARQKTSVTKQTVTFPRRDISCARFSLSLSPRCERDASENLANGKKTRAARNVSDKTCILPARLKTPLIAGLNAIERLPWLHVGD